MKVNLLGAFGIKDEIYSYRPDPTIVEKRKNYYDEFNSDFQKIYKNVIALKKKDIVEDGDFYLNRIWFYFNMGELNKAIEDAKHLRDSASYSRYSDRAGYYHNWALFSLFSLYVMTGEFEGAVSSLDSLLSKKKNESPEVYFSGHGSFVSPTDKVRLLIHFEKKDQVILFLKKTCREHFNWYFENAKPGSYYSSSAKEQGFYYLNILVIHLKKYGDPRFASYEWIYKELKDPLNKSYEAIDPKISDEKLRKIVSGI